VNVLTGGRSSGGGFSPSCGPGAFT
jgi:hypothetical protein